MFDIAFDLHPETEDPVKVHQLLSAILSKIDTELSVLGPVATVMFCKPWQWRWH